MGRAFLDLYFYRVIPGLLILGSLFYVHSFPVRRTGEVTFIQPRVIVQLTY
jgi:hypothetical protein